ncbi:MAG TPA: TfpX/TfpZ family type IV pilin accessory protein [Casimicrobiaceae bacterium]|nr:TfpX/TfpZ family type IV pilin accessory protein [Casimicrobiaceae bacterium]
MFALRSLNRFQAAGIHLAISTLVAATVLAALLLVWYPQPYFRLAGGAGLMLILIGVDVVLGPLLTLVVFDPRKKSLPIDLSVIALLQFAAFAYGISVIAQARPVYVVFAGERFTVVAANQIHPESLAAAKPPFDTLPVDGPRLVGARMPDDPGERQKLVLLAASGIDLPALPRHFVPFADVADDLKAKARPLAELYRGDAEAKARIDAGLARTGRPAGSLAWVPVLGRMEAATAIVDKSTGEVIAVLPVYPFR